MARPSKYPEELSERGVRMVAEAAPQYVPLQICGERFPDRGPDWGDDLEGEAAESPREGLPSGETWTAGHPGSALLSLSQITLLPLRSERWGRPGCLELVGVLVPLLPMTTARPVPDGACSASPLAAPNRARAKHGHPRAPRRA
jgi:hypothetical protein